MGASWAFFFGEKDAVLVEEIAKLYDTTPDVVKPLYVELVKQLKEEKSDK